MDCCREDLDEYFIVLGRRFFYLFELKNLRWSVFFIYDCFRLGTLPYFRCANSNFVVTAQPLILPEGRRDGVNEVKDLRPQE